MSGASDERPHLAALRDADPVRKASVAPPPRPQVVPERPRPTEPDQSSPPEPSPPVTDADASAEAEPPKRPAKRRSRTKSVSPSSGGRQRGNRREFQVRLTETVAALLYEISERERLTLGQAAMAAVRREHKALRAETVVTVEDDGFAPVELTRRQLGATEPKRLVTIRVTEAEADAFDQLADDTRMSYSLLLDEAIRRAHGLRTEDAAP